VNPAFGPIIDATESAWDKVFEVNLKAGFLLSRDVAKLMAKRGGGRLPSQTQHITTTCSNSAVCWSRCAGTIVFVSSYTGLKPAAGLGVYSVTKTAMLGLTRTLASEWVGMNIRVNAGACPPPT
jgi:dehydrogenase/reductase SDR family protein 4